jgi:hypothetical protein
MTATPEMVERMAKALDQAIEAAKAGDVYFLGDLARIAIATMREPTEAMLAAVVPRPDALIAERVAEGDDGYAQRMDAAVAAERAALAGRYREMIDAALANPSEIPNSSESAE